MADSANTTIAPAIPRATPAKEIKQRPLVREDLSYDRSAIMRSAWEDYRCFLNCDAGGRYRRTFGQCLALKWRVARNVRARRADGSIERERAERAASETLRQQLWASLTDEQRAAQDAWLIRQCSTDGRLPEHRNW